MSNKSLRRKPPPPIDTELHNENNTNKNTSLINQLENLHRKSFSNINNQRRLSQIDQNILNSQQQQQKDLPNIPYITTTPTRNSYNDTFDNSINESFTSFDSPKPKGPKDLWEYNQNGITSPLQDQNNNNFIPSSSTHASIQIKRILPKRSYQQISRSKSNSNSTIPTDESSPYDSPNHDTPEESRDSSFIEKTPKNPPYPTTGIEEYFDEDLTPEMIFEVPSPSQRRTKAIINQSINTTSPKINEVPNLSTRSSLSTIYGQHYQRQQMEESSPLSSNSPPISPYEENIPRRKLSMRSYNNYPDSEPYSRSPSPKRSYHSKNNSLNGYDNNYFSHNIANQYQTQTQIQSPDEYSPQSNNFNSRPSYRVVSDNPFYDEEENQNYEFESPATDYFDYSILPELPPSRDTSTANTSITIGPPLPKKLQELPPLPLDLPDLPFNTSSLQAQHFETCREIWSISKLFNWSCKLQIWLKGTSVSKQELKKAIIRLIAFHRSDISLDVLTKNSQAAFDSFLQAQAIELVELSKPNSNGDRSVVIFNEEVIVSGVLPGLTECYSPVPHIKDENEDSTMTCYSTMCNFSRMMNLERKMRTMNIKEIVLANDWAAHWRLTIDDLRDLNPSLIKRQSLIFDLLRYEQTFIQRAKCFVEIVGPEFIKAAKGYLGSNNSKIKIFEEEVLKTSEKILLIHQNQLFEPLLKILISEGKFIKNVIEIVSIYIDWAKEVRSYLIKYMNNMPMIEELLSLSNLKSYIDNKIGQLSRVKELKVNVPILFISTFNSRYQQIPLQILDIQKKYLENEPEFFLLKQASDEIKELGSKINDSKKFADNLHALEQLKIQLSWKSNLNPINLNLNSINRKLICRGDLTRRTDLKFTSQINHLIVLDNYIIITERLKNQKPNGALYKIYDYPIPIDFLIFEEKIVNNSSSSPATIKLSSSPITKPSRKSLSLDDNNEDHDDIQYSIKLRYAGKFKNSYTFTCKTEREYLDWINYLTIAKQKMNERLFNNIVFKPIPISTTCFAYEQNNKINKLQIVTPFDPIFEICQDSIKKFETLGISKDIYSSNNNVRNRMVFSSIQSSFEFQYNGRFFTFIGLNSGLYCCESHSHWKKILNGNDFNKIHVDTNLKIVLILNEKNLKYYLLNQLIEIYFGKRSNIIGISLSKDPILFFSMKLYKNIKMLFFAKKKNNMTNIKIIIPEIDNNGIFNRFKDYRKFFIEAECYGISIFNSSFVLYTDKGFEIMEIINLNPRSVPDLSELENDNVNNKKKIDYQFSKKSVSTTNINNGLDSNNHQILQTIKKLINSINIQPIGMYKLRNNKEFILIYSNFAIFINQRGKISRNDILYFNNDLKFKQIKFKNNYLFLINDEIIEILSISDLSTGSNKLIQCILGKDIHLISNDDDDDMLCFVMANPLIPGLQLVFKL
ncbi:TUS1 [Candida pseudojiufengensis]|uniref:TUS1 n=1 Tax=Candida pseudojiufengensis TaxID=497109 RepID=UPI002225AD7C|nr:TUS1 [Candida pseudojiufengensis]KAI5966554.1 TUS1 [Candida pseudojiufengensis]